MLAQKYEIFKTHCKFFLEYTLPVKLASLRDGRRLTRITGQPDGKRAGAVIGVIPYYGDEQILPTFLSYYRKLGVTYFVFLDISADHGLTTRLNETSDCAVWVPKGFMHPGKTIHALNYLRHRYARHKWCLSVEPSDLLVFPKSETRHIRDLIDFLESEQRKHIFAIVVDTYGDRPAAELRSSEDSSPFLLLPYFDRFGYQTAETGALGTVPILGGVQRRSLHGDEPHKAPVLSRIPLVKLNWDCYYLASTRLMVPALLNTAHCEWHSSTTACLLRYAVLSDEMSLHIAKQAEDGKLYPDSVTPTFAGSEAMTTMSLKNQGSGTFRGSQSLLDCGLLNNGQWF